MAHYFTNETGDRREYERRLTFGGREFLFTTSDGVFSKRDLDEGTVRLLEAALPHIKEGPATMVDLGCGYGAIGVIIAVFRPEIRCLMFDINEKAVELANINIQNNGLGKRAVAAGGDGLAGLLETVDYIVTNPPFRAGKQVVLRFFAQSHGALAPDGALFVVLRKQQGAQSYIRAIEDIFGNCDVLLKKKGYVVVKTVKKDIN